MLQFIEFYDVRDAQKALVALNKTQIGSKTIKIEPSRPGGSGKSSMRRKSAPSDNDTVVVDNINSNGAHKYTPEPSGYEGQRLHSNRSSLNYNYVPSPHGNDVDQNAIDIDAIEAGYENRTTLMIRNIPNKYSQALLLDSINSRHKGRYDFFYLPIDFGNKCNMGYAFINLSSPHDVVSFYELWNNCRWSHFNSDKVCNITFARIQGRPALENHFLASTVMTEDKGRRPMFFNDGIEVTDQLIANQKNGVSNNNAHPYHQSNFRHNSYN